MQYDIPYNAETRLMAYNGKIIIDVEDDDPIILRFIYDDSGGLLEGYEAYCVFDSAIRRKVIDDMVEVPIDVLIGDRIRIQLMFCKENKRFYSLNILTLKLNKVIS